MNVSGTYTSSIAIRLPVRQGFRKRFERLGFIFVDTINEKTFSAYAEPPKGWKVKVINKSRTIFIDANGLTRVEVSIKANSCAEQTKVKFFSKAEAISLDREKKRQQALQSERELENKFEKLKWTYETYICRKDAECPVSTSWQGMVDIAKRHPKFARQMPVKVAYNPRKPCNPRKPGKWKLAPWQSPFMREY